MFEDLLIDDFMDIRNDPTDRRELAGGAVEPVNEVWSTKSELWNNENNPKLWEP